MNSHFSNGRWDEGMVAGAEVLKETLMSGEYRGPVGENKSEKLGVVILIVGFGLFLLVMTLAIVSGRKSRKCPRCGKITLKQISATTISKKNGVKEELVTLKCTNCHHIVERTRKSYYSTGSNTTVPHIGGGFGGGFRRQRLFRRELRRRTLWRRRRRITFLIIAIRNDREKAEVQSRETDI